MFASVHYPASTTPYSSPPTLSFIFPALYFSLHPTPYSLLPTPSSHSLFPSICYPLLTRQLIISVYSLLATHHSLPTTTHYPLPTTYQARENSTINGQREQRACHVAHLDWSEPPPIAAPEPIAAASKALAVGAEEEVTSGLASLPFAASPHAAASEAEKALGGRFDLVIAADVINAEGLSELVYRQCRDTLLDEWCDTLLDEWCGRSQESVYACRSCCYGVVGVAVLVMCWC